MVLENLNNFFKDHKQVIRMTFEVFWIIVFLLDMIANKTGSSIPQFVYVNF